MGGDISDMKTKKNDASVKQFLANIFDEQQRADAQSLNVLFKEVTGEQPKMWGESIVGYGSYHYKYASGREGDWMKTGFSPRKGALTLYCSYGFDDDKDLMIKLGKHTTGKACLYIKKLSDVDLLVVKELISRTWNHHEKSGA